MNLSTPTTQELVRIWERGQQQHDVDRALTVLMAFSDESRQELAQVPLPERDALLIACRNRVSDGPLNAFAACPSCGCGVDVVLTPGDADSGRSVERVVEVDGAPIAFRQPTSLDLVAIASCDDVETARDLLIERCIDGVDPSEQTIAAVEREIERWAGAFMGAADLICPECHATWKAALDIGAFVWDEIAAYARQRLTEVDELARRYGWSEAEILGLSSARRRFYVGLV